MEPPTVAAEIPAATAAPPDPLLLRRLIDLDREISLWIHTACLRIPRSLLKALEISGDGRFWFPIPISLLPFSSRSPILLGLLLGSLLDLLFIGFIKHLVRRPRPVYNKGMHLAFSVDHWSFPSGHSSRVFFIAAFLNLSADALRLLLRSRGWSRTYNGGEPAALLLLIVNVWSTVTSASRVPLGRHFVLDVIAGACLGVLEALFVFYLFFHFHLIV
ncbi:dolichyldiphosphatase [Apostasia shenzhenica]|uniref:Dolichyldiphosphatase n=1 Tax=Apostasia shenzhenica TaxID=1088818 RepID=A0A2I0B8U3_9ASPA|nr:dolichyldiphosphatase [Apostasia shenzhenica]